MEERLRQELNNSLGITHCPACGRYVGPLEICSYCRHHIKRPWTVLLLKYGSVLASVLGLFCLYSYGITRGNPEVRIGDLQKTSNYAYVRLHGQVSGIPRAFENDDGEPTTLDFTVNDGSGSLSVKAYRDAALRLISAGKIPFLMDSVMIEGSYQVRGDNAFIILNSERQIEISRPSECPTLSLADIKSLSPKEPLKNACVTLTGRLRGLDEKRYHLEVDLIDDSGAKLPLKFEKSYLHLLNGKTDLGALPEASQLVRVRGILRYDGFGKYRSWKLYPASPKDIEIQTP
jgi:uncharacterized OB-fold protein